METLEQQVAKLASQAEFEHRHRDLRHFIAYGDVKEVREKLFAGYDIAWNKNSFLNTAVRTGRKEMIELLFQAGADPMASNGSIFRNTFTERFPMAFQAFIEGGANLNVISYDEIAELEHFLAEEGTQDEDTLSDMGFESVDDYETECEAAHDCLAILYAERTKHGI